MRALVLCAAVLAAASFAACGDDEPAAKTAAAKPKKPAVQVSDVIELTALVSNDKPYRFDKKELTAKAGLVEFRLTNLDPGSTHNIRIQTGEKCCDPANDVGGTDSIDGPDGKITGRVRLEPGTYWFLCSLGGHFDGDMGKMKGKLVVQ